MLRKIVCLSFAPALGITLVVLIMLASSTSGAGAAPLVPSGSHVGTAGPGTRPNATGVLPASNPQLALPAAPAGGIGMIVNYAHNWVCTSGGLPEDQIQITVKRGDDVLATLGSNNRPDGSYCSNEHNDWLPQEPDIHVGDSVTVRSNDTSTMVDPVGEIAGTLNVGTATVSGNLHVPSLAPGALTVVCEVWAENNTTSPIVLHNVPADGGAYTCNFGAQSFDMAPGNDIAVRYYEPDGDQVINVFHAPAPDLNIDMWNEGQAVAGAGGLALFHVYYQNAGDAAAADVVITDTLPADVSYVQDTTAVTPVVNAGQAVWHLGTLAPGETGHFFVVLANTLGAGATLENTVDIATSSPGDNLGDNHRSVGIPVESGAPDVYIGQGVQPGDPLAGDSYRIEINYGNNGPVPAGPVTLHLQLPADTTLQTWFSSNNYDQLWTLTSSAGNELIFVASALPAGFGDQLEVRAGIASSLGSKAQLSSTAWIETAGDSDTSNDGPDTQDVWTTDEPRPDLSVDKQWGYGILAPGGLAWYQINYNNDGSLTQAGVRLTDTLPAGTHFVEATVDSNWGFSQSVPPVYQSGNVLAWDLGTLPAASWGHLKVRLALDDVTAGATITNTARIAGQDNDLTWFNNDSAAVEHVNAAGANLRLRQTSWWEWPGQLRFDLQFENAGTTIVKDVHITDTVPTGLDFNGDWWGKWGDGLGYNYNPVTRQIVWTINRLEPANTGSISMHFDVPSADIGHQGLQYTNVAQITQPAGEVSPADNSTTMLAFSGPDLFVGKTLWSGEVAPDALVTFAIDFGNHNNGPWWTGQPAPNNPAVVITDTLPAGMTFVSATNPWSLNGSWDPQQDGNKLIWGLDNLCPKCHNVVLVTVHIDEAVKGGTKLTNVVEISDIAPGDVDIFPDNNTASWSAGIGAATYLPMLKK